MRLSAVLALLLGPSLVVLAVSIPPTLDDDHMSAPDVWAFCASYRRLIAIDSRSAEGVTTVKRLLAAAPDNRKDDIRLFYTFTLGLGPQNKSGMDAERAGRNIDRTAARRC